MKTQPADFYRRWYLQLAALWFSVVCLCSMGYAFYHMTEPGFILPVFSFCMTAVLAVSSLIYLFFSPRIGHPILLGAAIFILLTQGQDGTTGENVFWIMMVLLLLLPMRHRTRKTVCEL